MVQTTSMLEFQSCSRFKLYQSVDYRDKTCWSDCEKVPPGHKQIKVINRYHTTKKCSKLLGQSAKNCSKQTSKRAQVQSTAYQNHRRNTILKSRKSSMKRNRSFIKSWKAKSGKHPSDHCWALFYQPKLVRSFCICIWSFCQCKACEGQTGLKKHLRQCGPFFGIQLLYAFALLWDCHILIFGLLHLFLVDLFGRHENKENKHVSMRPYIQTVAVQWTNGRTTTVVLDKLLYSQAAAAKARSMTTKDNQSSSVATTQQKVHQKRKMMSNTETLWNHPCTRTTASNKKKHTK